MTVKNLNDDPFKVKNWNNPNEKMSYIDYNLSIIEDEWVEIGIEILPDGTTKVHENYVCSMPF